MTRDSWPVFWVGAALAIVAYLQFAERPPTAWLYADWLQATSVVLLWVSAKLGNSPLPGRTRGKTT